MLSSPSARQELWRNLIARKRNQYTEDSFRSNSILYVLCHLAIHIERKELYRETCGSFLSSAPILVSSRGCPSCGEIQFRRTWLWKEIWCVFEASVLAIDDLLLLKQLVEQAVMFVEDRDQHLCAESERTCLNLQKVVNVHSPCIDEPRCRRKH